MATTSTALVPLGDRDYIAKMTNHGTPDDLLALVTAQEAKALSDVALVIKVEAQGEVWSHVRTYINEWLVGRFPVFDELAIRIADRKRKGMSPLIIRGQPCHSFKQAIRLILECDPSHYFKIRKKHLGGGWQKALPAEATAPDKAGVAETSVTDIKVDEPDAKDAEVCDPDPVPMPGDGTVDKVHSAANETATDINVSEPEVVEATPTVTDEEVARIHEAAAADTLPEVEDEVAAEQQSPETEEPRRTGRPSWDSVAADFRKVFSSRYQRDKRIKRFFEEVGEEFYDDIREAADSLVTPTKDESESRSVADQKPNETRRAKAGRDREERKQEVMQKVRQDIVRRINEDSELDYETKAAAIAFVNELGKEEEDAAVKARVQVDTVNTDTLGRMLGDDAPLVLVSPEPETVATVLKPEPVKKGRVWSGWAGRECPQHEMCNSLLVVRSTTPVAARLEAQRLLDENQWTKPWRDINTSATCSEANTVKSWVGSVSNAGHREHDIDITNQDPARKKAARLVHVKELIAAAEKRLKDITGKYDEDADDRRYTEEARDVERKKIARLEKERATLEVALNATGRNAPVSDEVKAAALAEAAEMLQAHYPEVASGTPPAKPPESGLEPMAHAGEVATILIDLMERGGKPTYGYAELQRAFLDADTGFRHRSFVQATKLLKERGYYPTGNVLAYNPHPASQPSEGAKEQSAGA